MTSTSSAVDPAVLTWLACHTQDGRLVGGDVDRRSVVAALVCAAVADADVAPGGVVRLGLGIGEGSARDAHAAVQRVCRPDASGPAVVEAAWPASRRAGERAVTAGLARRTRGVLGRRAVPLSEAHDGAVARLRAVALGADAGEGERAVLMGLVATGSVVGALSEGSLPQGFLADAAAERLGERDLAVARCVGGWLPSGLSSSGVTLLGVGS